MTITGGAKSVIFTFSSSRVTSVEKGSITEVKKHYDYAKGKYRVVVSTAGGNKLQFYFDEVTSPVAEDVDALIALIEGYNA